jgi:hypothetical protein
LLSLIPSQHTAFMARGFIPVRLQSSRKTCELGFS